MDKIIRCVVVPVACVVGVVLGPVVSYAQGHDHHGHGAEAPAAVKGTAQGEIRRIDKANGRVTIRHGEIAHLDMPGMTMVFGVKDPEVLEGVAVGDKVEFEVERREGELVVTRIGRQGEGDIR